VRRLFLGLLTANLIFLGWSQWVAPRAELVPPAKAPDLPRIRLASEAALAPAAGARQPDSAAVRCLSLGPFPDANEATRASGQLGQAGYSTQPRTEETRTTEGWWVSLPREANNRAESLLLARLARFGVTDATILSDAEDRRVSLGLFSARAEADKRAIDVQRLGYRPDVTERLRIGTTYWVDLNLRTAQEVIEAEQFNLGAGQLDLRPCPTDARALASANGP